MQSRRSTRVIRPAHESCHAGARLAIAMAVGCALLGSPARLSAQATAVRVAPEGSGEPPTVQRSATGRGYGPPAPIGHNASGTAIPPKYAPPGGMCRVWVQGVPPAQQPAPTQCAKAVRVHSPNSQVVFGPSRSGTGVSVAQPHPGVVSVGSEHVAPGNAPVPHPNVDSRPAATNAPEAAVKDRVNTGPHGSSTHGSPPPPHILHIPARPHH